MSQYLEEIHTSIYHDVAEIAPQSWEELSLAVRALMRRNELRAHIISDRNKIASDVFAGRDIRFFIGSHKALTLIQMGAILFSRLGEIADFTDLERIALSVRRASNAGDPFFRAARAITVMLPNDSIGVDNPNLPASDMIFNAGQEIMQNMRKMRDEAEWESLVDTAMGVIEDYFGYMSEEARATMRRSLHFRPTGDSFDMK